MANPLLATVLAGSTYDPNNGTISGVYGGRGGRFFVKNGNVFIQLQYSRLGGEEWTPEEEAPPGPGTIDAGAIGITFRNADATAPATVSASIQPPNRPGFQLGSSGVSAVSVIPTLAYQQVVLANNVTITLAGTWVNVMTLTLTSGVWLCHSRLVLTRAGGVAGFSGRIIVTGSGSGGASTESYGATAGQPFELAISTIVTIGAAGGGITTSAASTGGTATLLATIPDYPGIAVATASELHAVQIG